MVMVGHSKRLAEPLTRRQSRALLAVAVSFVLALVGVILYASLHGDSYGDARHGCISIVVASSTGGALLHECGSAARELCRAEDGLNDAFARLVQPHCRRAGYPPARIRSVR
jgi:hypothetical protein